MIILLSQNLSTHLFTDIRFQTAVLRYQTGFQGCHVRQFDSALVSRPICKSFHPSISFPRIFQTEEEERQFFKNERGLFQTYCYRFSCHSCTRMAAAPLPREGIALYNSPSCILRTSRIDFVNECSLSRIDYGDTISWNFIRDQYNQSITDLAILCTVI